MYNFFHPPQFLMGICHKDHQIAIRFQNSSNQRKTRHEKTFAAVFCDAVLSVCPQDTNWFFHTLFLCIAERLQICVFIPCFLRASEQAKNLSDPKSESKNLDFGPKFRFWSPTGRQIPYGNLYIHVFAARNLRFPGHNEPRPSPEPAGPGPDPAGPSPDPALRYFYNRIDHVGYVPEWFLCWALALGSFWAHFWRNLGSFWARFWVFSAPDRKKTRK